MLKKAALFCLFCSVSLMAQAQKFKSPVEYMNYIGDLYSEVSVEFYRYMSAVAHANSARKVEKRREQLLKTSWDTYTKVRTMPLYEGNRSLRDSAAHFLNINHRVLKEDYDMILDMERIAEQSYDAMEAYLLAQREARNKLDVANIRMLVEQRKFAQQYQLDLKLRDDKVFEKMTETNEALNYLNKVYLLFFKCHKQEIYLLDAMANRHPDAIEQQSRLLLQAIEEAQATLRKLAPYKADRSLEAACLRILEFYQSEAEKDVAAMLRYIAAESDFAQARIRYEALSKDQRTQENVDAYNTAVRAMNTAADAFNALNGETNQQRIVRTEKWAEAYDTFLDRHIPYF